MIEIDDHLSMEDFLRVIRDHEPVDLSVWARERLKKGRAAVEKILRGGEAVYGVNTGFGKFQNTRIEPDKLRELQRNLILSHAIGVGGPFPADVVRGILLLRAQSLARGRSGVREQVVQRLLDFLNRELHPIIPSQGSVGASGDLAPLAHMALVMIGEGQARYQDETLSGAEALQRAGLAPVILAAKEGLALTNGTSVMCAVGTLAVHAAEQLSQAADTAGCLSLEALHGTPLAFDARIHAARPHPRQVECAAYLRALIAGSEFTRAFDPTNVQDAYTLRCIPQIHGAVRDAIAYARWVIEIELNAVTDNPLIFFDEQSGDVSVISGGNFHGEPIAMAMDFLAIAITELGNVSERRIMRLTDGASNAFVLPPFLTKDGGLNSGFMITQYTAAALATENKILAHPASVDNIPTSANVEDHVSMGNTACLKVRQVIENTAHILAIELMAAAQGIDFRREVHGASARLGAGTGPVYEQVPFIKKDMIMYTYIDMVREMIQGGQVGAVVKKSLAR